jgi:hypothetical protein
MSPYTVLIFSYFCLFGPVCTSRSRERSGAPARLLQIQDG